MSDPTLDPRFVSKSVRPARVNKVYNNTENPNRASTSQEIRIDIPYINKNERNPVKSLKNQLFDVIVKNRIYKEKDIQHLFRSTRKTNQHISENIVEDAISLAYKDLND
jgi:hypothetical protein